MNRESGGLVDRFLCYMPTLSPDHQLLTYGMFFPPHFVEGPSYEYMLYDFRKSAIENRPSGVPADDPQRVGRTLYPPLAPGQLVRNNTGVPEDQAHFLVSGFFWAPNSRTVGFVDQVNRGLALVRVDIPAEGQGDYRVYRAEIDYPPNAKAKGNPARSGFGRWISLPNTKVCVWPSPLAMSPRRPGSSPTFRRGA